MEVTELGIDTLARPRQTANAEAPIEVTELGMMELLQPIISVLLAVSMMALQLSRESYCVLSLSTVIRLRPLHSRNTALPIEVTNLGIDTLVRPVQP